MNITRHLSLRKSAKNVGSRSSVAGSSRLPGVSKKGAVDATVVQNPVIVMSSSSSSSSNSMFSEENLQTWRDWVGHRVTISGVKFGVLRYFGETQFASGWWCGVELDEPVGKNNGFVNGVQYFACEDKFGIFAPVTKTSKLSDDNKYLDVAKKPLRSRLPSPTSRRTPITRTEPNLDRTYSHSNLELRNIVSDDVVNANEITTTNCNETFHLQACNNNEIENSHHNDSLNLPDNIICSTPAIKRPSEEDILNQTVTVNSFEEFTIRNTGNDGVFVGNLLNASLDLPPLPPTTSSTNQKESTFILDKSNIEVFPGENGINFGSNDNLLSVDFDESLGLLSPSKMKDFNTSFDFEFRDKPPGIPKNESCDDVNDLPESEVTSLNQLASDSANATTGEPWADETITDQCQNQPTDKGASANDVFYKDDCEDTDKNSNVVPSGLTKVCKEFDSILDTDVSQNASFEVMNPKEFESIFGSASSTLVDRDGSVMHSSNAVGGLEKPLKKLAPSNNLLQFALSSQRNLNRLSAIPEARMSLAFINNETLPDVSLNISDFDCRHSPDFDSRNSLSFLGKASPVTTKNLSENDNLMNFSGMSPQFVPTAKPADLQMTIEPLSLDAVDKNIDEEEEKMEIDSVYETKLIDLSECRRETMPDLISKISEEHTLISVESVPPEVNEDSKVSQIALNEDISGVPSSQNEVLYSVEKPDLLCNFADDQMHKPKLDQVNQETGNSNFCSTHEGDNVFNVTVTIATDSTESSNVKRNLESESLTSSKVDTFGLTQAILNRTVSLEYPTVCGTDKHFRPVCSSQSTHFNSPINNQLDDISIISGDVNCFETSDVFESGESVFSQSSLSNKLNRTYQVCSKSNFDLDSKLLRRQTITPTCTVSKPTKNKVQITEATKPPRKSIVSKVKTMIESSKKPASDQENVDVKNTTFTQKKPGKWDAITSKINAGLAGNTTSKLKEKAVSKVQQSLNVRRQSTPKTSPGRSTNDKTFCKPESTAVKNLKNSLESNNVKQANLDTSNRDGKILTQLQNVDCAAKVDNVFKVPQSLVRKAPEQVLPSPCGSGSTTNTATFSSSNASKMKFLAKPGGLKIPSVKVPGVAKTSKASASSTSSSLVPKSSRPLLGGKLKESNKETKSGRWSTGSSTPKPDVRKFVSKAELVREIQELGANCEIRTKELNLLKIRMKHATLAFEAFAVLNKYMVEQYDPFSQPQLSQQYEKAKDELTRAEEQLYIYQIQLKDMQNVHSEELKELTEKLGAMHAGEINELKMKHVEELDEADQHHKQQVSKLREAFKQEAEDSEERNFKLIKNCQDEYKKQKHDLEESHVKKIKEVTDQHEEMQCQLQKRLQELDKQYNSLQRQLKDAEEVFMKDKNSKIQYMSSKKTQLEQEVESLKAVLEIKSSQIQDLHKENFKIKRELEELPAAKEKISKLEIKTEDLKALMQEKVKHQRELYTENQQLVIECEKEAKENSRLSMANEELQWRLQQSMETSHIRSASLSGSPVLWAKNEDRTSSRMSLPILQSEKYRSVSPTVDERPISSREYSMSLSWHPALATHSETPVPETSTPVRTRDRPRSVRDSRVYWPSHSKLSTVKAQKDIVADIMRRNSCGRLPDTPPSMSMSWGGETFSDYYEELDDSCIEICADQRQMGSRKFFIKFDCDKQKGKNKSRRMGPMADIDIDKSISGLASMQSSFAENSSSYQLLSQPEYETPMSTSTSSTSSKSQESNGYMFGDVKAPMDFAGESMILEAEAMSNGLLKSKNLSHLADGSSSSPDDVKDNANHAGSMATPSIDTSSQGMADSTNLDVSWGDEEMPSENDI